MATDLVALETTVDTQSPADVSMWLRRRARINREFAETPPAQHMLEDWQRNVMPHLAFRFEQIADLVDKQAERVAWFENYVKACDNEVIRANQRRMSIELELDAALMQLQGLKDLLSQAVDDIESWSGYASTYFHEKHDLKGCLARYRAALDVPAEPLCDHGIPVNSPSACPTCHSEQPTRNGEHG